MKTLEFVELELKKFAKSEIEQTFTGLQVKAVNQIFESIQFEPELSNIDQIIDTNVSEMKLALIFE